MTQSRRTFVKILGGTAVIGAASVIGLRQCDPMPPEAVVAWTGPDGSITDPREKCLAFALLAPNPHNKQPWIADLRQADAITLSVDRTRLLPHTDPPSRQITIGCGAFLELLRMAAAAQGFRAGITYFPDGPWADGQVGDAPLARIVLSKDESISPDPLFVHVLQRQTNRGAYSEVPLSADQAGKIGAAINEPGVEFGWTAEASRLVSLRALAKRGWDIEVNTDRAFRESVDVFRITGPEILKHRDGISLHGPFIWWVSTLGFFSRETAFDEFGRGQARAQIDPQLAGTASFAWLITQNNDRLTQLAAGRAYVRGALMAAGLGLTQGPLSQVLQEFVEMAEPYQEIKTLLNVPPASTVQMFYRIGTAARATLAPRRALSDLLRT
ncbi:MAG TPA: twin-arginine translocation pathway signal protein [Alphaproteobacteria bacterium]|nr:twin-arginine translocation pathway signal protein [Alphaproteobacteria bacterium]HAJ45364.1 twin-arginine translocation pathway signal protein [Alphaproteobacteria bacterium]